MKRVLCLYRVSTKMQLDTADDLPMQRSECMKFIEGKDDWVFQEEILEKGVSGFKKSVAERDALQEIMGKAERKEFDILLVYMSDRIGRKEDETPVYVSTLNMLGIEVWSVNEGQFKTEEHVDKLLNYIRFWQAEGESRKTGIRVRDGQIEKVKQGKFTGGYAPYGYELVYSGEISKKGRALKKLVVKPEEAEVIKKIFDYAVNYRLGSLKIAKELNVRKIPSPKGGQWGAPTISQILKNPIYKGYMAYGKRKNHGKLHNYDRREWLYSEEQNTDWAIISEQDWEKTQRLRESRQSQKRDGSDCVLAERCPTSTTGMLLLTGMVYCGYCGKKLTNASKYSYWTTKDGVKHKNVEGRYRCVDKAKGSLECQGKSSYPQRALENIVKEEVAVYMDNLKKVDIYEEIITIQKKQREEEEKQLLEIKKQMERIGADIETMYEKVPDAIRGEFALSIEKLSLLISDKESEREKLEHTYEVMHKEFECRSLERNDLKLFGEMIPNWREEFEKAPLIMKKALLSKVVDRIEVKEDSIKVIMKIRLSDFLHGKSIDCGTTPYIRG